MFPESRETLLVLCGAWLQHMFEDMASDQDNTSTFSTFPVVWSQWSHSPSTAAFISLSIEILHLSSETSSAPFGKALGPSLRLQSSRGMCAHISPADRDNLYLFMRRRGGRIHQGHSVLFFLSSATPRKCFQTYVHRAHLILLLLKLINSQHCDSLSDQQSGLWDTRPPPPDNTSSLCDGGWRM